MPDHPLEDINEKFYRSLAESARDFIFVIDRDLKLLYCNECGARALGQPQDRIIGRALTDLFPAEVARRERAAVQQVIDSRNPRTTEGRFAFPGGTLWLSTTLAPLFNEAKELVSILGIARDISAQKAVEEQRGKELEQLRLFQRLAVDREMKLMEIEKGIVARDETLGKLKAQIAGDRQALRQTEQKYMLLLDSTPVAIGLADQTGRVLEINKAMEEMTGYTIDDYRQINLVDTYCNPVDRERLLALMQSRSSVHDFEVCLKHKNGTIYSALLNLDQVEIGGQKIIITTCRDISELNKVRKTLGENEEKIKKYESTRPEVKGPES